MKKGKKLLKVTRLRSFGGKTENFVDKQEQAFEQRHLKAYLKGKKMFQCGFKTIEKGNLFRRVPAMFPVKEIWTNVKLSN